MLAATVVPREREKKTGVKQLRAVLVVLAAVGLVLIPAATANTPDPSSVTVAGSLQSEFGCVDWQADCAATHLTYDAADDVWQGTLPLAAGAYEYKAATGSPTTRAR
jgi:hypothetical protein